MFAVEDDGYVTKGDANPTPDPESLTADQIDGIGRLVVPFVGLPAVWWTAGNQIAFVSWAMLTVLVARAALSQASRSRQRRATGGARTLNLAVADSAIRQVRVLVALITAAQYLIDPERLAVPGTSIGAPTVLGTTILVLGVTNLGSLAATRAAPGGWIAKLRVMAEPAVDTVLVVALVTATGTSGIGWVLFALPIIEVAARFRLTGALLSWVLLAGLTVGLRIWIDTNLGTPAPVLLDELDTVVDQLSVLLLVVIPASYLVEQLVEEVATNRHATSHAVRRGELLHHVVDLGRTVTKLDHSLFTTLVEATEQLGFAAADVAARVDPDGAWQVLASSPALNDRPLPSPGWPGSTLQTVDLAHDAVIVNADDPDAAERDALAACGWGRIVRLTVPTSDGTMVAVRVVTEPDTPLDPDATNALTLLLGQVSVGLQNDQLLAELRALNERMAHEATHDSLTGLPNRVDFLHRLAQLNAEMEHRSGVAVLFIDLNGFKPVNDRLGHEAGDELLKLVAIRLTRRVAAVDLVARLGGDEFTVLLPDIATPAEAANVAERLVDALDEPFMIGSDPVRIGAAIGVAHADDAFDASELIRQADVAMYRAKRDRHHSVLQYEPAMDAADIRQARLASDLDSALDANEIEMHLQPLVRTEAGTIAGVEALIRWSHPELGTVPAPEIIAVAEQAGRAARLNRWILAESLRSAEAIIDYVDPDDFFVSINASPIEAQLPTFAEHVAAALASSSFEPQQVLIELSERVVLDDDEVIPRNLARLEALGVQVLLDDFGEGRTTLGHLRRLPLVGLKLDRSFFCNVDEHPDDEVIIRSIVTMAHELGLAVVGEGVETAFHVDVARRCRVDLLQGYGCCRPMPALDLIRWLTDGGDRRPAPAAEPDPGMVR
ncbi:MAG: EAL domain-containing protein [Actinomycetota bacterium]